MLNDDLLLEVFVELLLHNSDTVLCNSVFDRGCWTFPTIVWGKLVHVLNVQVSTCW